jgi:chorismate synthase
MVRYTTAGESHGKALIALVEGIPAGVAVSTQQIRDELAKRRGGIGRGERQKFEQDEVTILSGVLQGKTIASPIAIEILNTEWPKWTQIMSADAIDGGGSLPLAAAPNGSSATPSSGESPATPPAAAPNVPRGEEFDRLMRPRPGHADLEGIRKYGFENARPVLERASARETAARVAAGAIAKAYIKQAAGIEVTAKVVQFGSAVRGADDDVKFDERAQAVANEAVANGETVGGIVEVVAKNVPAGLGSYISAQTRLDSKLAGALMSIQAVKGVQIGEGFGYADLPGSQAHDVIAANGADFVRKTNHAGGIEGGISNGEDIVASIVVKPIPSVPGGLETVDLATGNPARGHSQRSDCSAVYPARCVAEAEVALVLADVLTAVRGVDVV